MYTIEQLILDQTFLNYCYKSNAQDVQTWEHYAASSPENKASVEEARKMILGQKQGNPTQVIKRSSFVRFLYAAAAVVLLVMGVALFEHYQEEQQLELAFKIEEAQYHVYKSPFGERISITLADHSKVILNAHSTLKVPRGYNKDSRKVVLLGAAYFDISPNAELPFMLVSSDMKATVFGTSFYMRAYPHESGQQVELLTGKLKVQKAYTSDIDNKPEILLPGDMVMLNRTVDLMEKETFDIGERESWIKGRLKFKNASFRAVVTALEDWYGVPIEIRGQQKSQDKFSGTYENESLERVLNKFCFATDCNFKIEKEKVILRFN